MDLLTTEKQVETYVENHIFTWSMYWRILYGFLRLMLGLILLRYIGDPFSDIFYRLMSHEFVEDPSDLLLTVVKPLAHYSTLTVSYFVAVHFMFWGVMDIALSVALLRRERWAFTASVYIIGAFTLYEIYRVLHTHSKILLGIIFIDICILLLIHREKTKLP